MKKQPRTLEQLKQDAAKHKCTMCGKEFDIFDEQQGIEMDHWCGYGSHHDMSHIQFRLCNECFDKVMDKIIPLCKNQVVFDDCFAWVDTSRDLTEDQKERIKKILTAVGARKEARIHSQICTSNTRELLTIAEEEMRKEGYDIDSKPLDMNLYFDRLSKSLEEGLKERKEKKTVIQETRMDNIADCFLVNHRNAFEELGK